MRTLGRINVTPVKGMALHHPERVTLTGAGIPGNRLFYLVDEAGGLFSGGDLGQLVRIRPDYEPSTESLTLTFPDGAVVSGGVGDLGASEVTDFYGRSVPARAVRGPWSNAMSAFARRQVRLLRCDRDGDGADEEPLTIVSYASVSDLADHGRHEGTLDSRRFRINLELEGCSPYEEDSWDGHQVRIGQAEIVVRGQIPRCVVTTQDPETGLKDWDTLTQIAKYRPRIPDGGLPFGMYAVPARPGTIAVGDPVDAAI
jgi:uncharacterized protein YcbX